MGFVTPALLGGIVLVGLPIVLHLVMRREAQHLLFPALRFVQQRKSSNQHRLRLRHLLLLAMRCAIIGLMALALARPALRGSGILGNEGGPIAAALVFDNSLRMSYIQKNETRLEQAQTLALWLLDQLPAESPIMVFERATTRRSGSMDRAVAELRVSRLECRTAVRPFGEAIRDACDWLREQKNHRGEIYIFTDMAQAAWSDETLLPFAEQLDELSGANVYLIDVGAEEPHNLGLEPVRLSSEVISPQGRLRLESAVHRVRHGRSSIAMRLGESVTVELLIEDREKGVIKRGEQVVDLSDQEPAAVEFSLSGLELGTHQGYLRINRNDPLAYDNVRYFTVDVRPPRALLLLGDREADTLFLREALFPTPTDSRARSKFDCQTDSLRRLVQSSAGELDKGALDEFDAICLVDPSPLPEAAWESLVDFVHAGGGLGLFLGRDASRDAFNGPSPQRLLPARLRWQSRDATYLRTEAVEHPALAGLRDFVGIVPWSEFPVFKFWELEPLISGVHVVASYANGKPALLERQVGSGRVLTLTTPVSDLAHANPWNLLPTGPDPWPFLAFADGIAEYLTGTNETRLNYQAGQTALLKLPLQPPISSYVLRMPGSEAVRQSLAPGQQDLHIASTERLGNYRVLAGGEQGALDRGFSMNAPATMSRLERAPFEPIAEVLGKDRVRLAHTREEIEVRVGLGRVGWELFPWLILAMALVLGAEQVLSNRFYRES